MTFAHADYLYGLILIPLLMLFLMWAHRRRMEAVNRLGNAALIERLSSAVNRRGRRWKTRLWMVAMVLLIIALARPQWGSRVESVEQEGVQVMVALDISNSMLAQDIRPDRLTRAKLEISDLMNRLDGDEIGLVLFSGASFIQFPLTSDYETARAFLNNANPGIISRQGTAIGEAIDTAMTGFDEKLSSQKVIVIVTDGENHESDVMAAAKKAADNDIIIYTIGFGSPDGEPIPEFNDQGELTGYKKDQNGDVVLSKLDEDILQQIASATGGQYFRTQPDGSELDALAGSLNNLQQSTLQTRFQTRHIERYQGFLLAGLLLLVLGELIPERRRESRLRVRVPRLKLARLLPFFVIVLLLAACDSAAKQNNAGNDAFQKGDYETALQTYQDAQQQNPDLAEPDYNAANAYYRQQDYENAQKELQSALTKGDDNLAAHSYYNMGNIAFHNQDYQAAVEAYKNTLRIHPDDADAKYNLELALQKLQDQQNQQQTPTPQSTQDQQQQQQQSTPTPQDQQNQSQQGTPTPQGTQENPQNGDGQQSTPTPQLSQQAQQQNQQGLTPDQARQLLSSVAQGSKTLQEELQGVYVVPGSTPVQDW